MAFANAFQVNAFQNNAFQIYDRNNSGGGGSRGAGRRRNINDDPDAYSDFFKTIRDRNAPPAVIEPPIDFGPDPFEALLAEQNALQAALQAREGMIAIFEAQQRLAQAERAWQQFLDDDEDDLLLLIS